MKLAMRFAAGLLAGAASAGLQAQESVPPAVPAEPAPAQAAL